MAKKSRSSSSQEVREIQRLGANGEGFIAAAEDGFTARRMLAAKAHDRGGRPGTDDRVVIWY